MDLLCPACQQQLTIPDDFAGQPAKCPQCGHTFTAPALSPMPAAYTPPAPPPPAPAPAPQPQPLEPSVPSLPNIELPAPAVPAPVPAAPAATPAPAVTPPSGSVPAPAPLAPTPEPPPADYTRRWSIWIGPNFWCWVAVAAAVLVFVLSFFPWVGYFPGGEGVRTQSAWQAAFGAQTVDKELGEMLKDKPLFKGNPLFDTPADDKEKPKSPGPGANGLLIVYVLLLIPLLLLTGAVAVWNVLPRELPPAVQKLKPWRWGIVAGVALLALLLLTLQMVTGFTLESSLQTTADQVLKPDLKQQDAKQPAPGSKEARALRVMRGLVLSPLQRTGALRAASSLHLLLFVSALIMFWLERRGNKPHPRIDVLS
ncbi:MAG: zinc-ribbon domain-containing protein [Gemmataceae bacterium]|nr:zinc-ribbon domain-containing protein [Gemmataceae bacterium]